jgi:hypothetical protein
MVKEIPSILGSQLEKSYLLGRSPTTPVPSFTPGKIIHATLNDKHKIAPGWIAFRAYETVECPGNCKKELHFKPVLLSVYTGVCDDDGRIAEKLLEGRVPEEDENWVSDSRLNNPEAYVTAALSQRFVRYLHVIQEIPKHRHVHLPLRKEEIGTIAGFKAPSVSLFDHPSQAHMLEIGLSFTNGTNMTSSRILIGSLSIIWTL